MKIYIDSEKLCELARNHIDKKVDANDIMRFPAADVQEVRHGRWNTDRFGMERSICSLCGAVYEGGESWNYCPKCGARMDGENNG